MSWLQRFFVAKEDRPADRARMIHAAIVRKARQPDLYSEGLVADDLEGRFHAVALYSATVIPLLENAGPEGPALVEALNTVIFDSFDAALRETGVGDASIARKVRKMGEQFVGLGRAVNEALRSDEPDAGLANVVRRNGIASDDGSLRLARRIIQDSAALCEVPRTEIIAGRLPW